MVIFKKVELLYRVSQISDACMGIFFIFRDTESVKWGRFKEMYDKLIPLVRSKVVLL